MMSPQQRRLLFCLAHPDDESFGYAGTLARYSQEGVDVHLICATNGDVGTVSDEFMQGFDSVADLRLHELACAAEVLGLTVHTFGYRDSGMQGSDDNRHPESLASQDLDTVAGRVVEVIRKVRPQVVVTFDPRGGYGHPDHIKIHEATVRAFHAAGDANLAQGDLMPYQPQKLYYGTFDRRLMRALMPLAPLFGIDPTRMGRNKDMNFKEIAEDQWPVHARIRVGAYKDEIARAWDCHASQQFTTNGGGLFLAMRRLTGRNDTYMRVHPPVNGKVLERDLFAGVEREEALA